MLFPFCCLKYNVIRKNEIDAWLYGYMDEGNSTSIVKCQWYIWVVHIKEFTVESFQLFYIFENYHNKLMPQ